MELVKSAVVELRPRLRSCGVFLTTVPLVDRDCLKITVRPDCILLSYNRCQGGKTRERSVSSSSYEDSSSEHEDDVPDIFEFLDVKPHCKLIPGSLTSLNIEKNVLSFRILTEPPLTTDNFFKEVLRVDDRLAKYEVGSATTERQSLNSEILTDVKITCANCFNAITPNVNFARVLELPSDNLDMSEWFCHGPDGKCGHSNDKKKQTFKAEAKKNDLFYGLCCFIVDPVNFTESFLRFNKKRSVLYCNRCLCFLGKKINVSDFKFWNSTVNFEKIGVQRFCLLSYSNTDSFILNETDAALKDFLFCVKRLVRDSQAGLQSSSACRIIIECIDKSDVLLVWVMDLELQVLTVGNAYEKERNSNAFECEKEKCDLPKDEKMSDIHAKSVEIDENSVLESKSSCSKILNDNLIECNEKKMIIDKTEEECENLKFKLINSEKIKSDSVRLCDDEDSEGLSNKNDSVVEKMTAVNDLKDEFCVSDNVAESFQSSCSVLVDREFKNQLLNNKRCHSSNDSNLKNKNFEETVSKVDESEHNDVSFDLNNRTTSVPTEKDVIGLGIGKQKVSRLANRLLENKSILKIKDDMDCVFVDRDRSLIKLESKVTSKLLYKICKDEGLGFEWENAPRTEVTPSMLKVGLAHLEKCALGLPVACRTTNGYNLTYLHI